MSYRYEKEEGGKTAIVISGWEKGIGSSPEGGHGFLTQASLEIDKEISAGWPLTASTFSGSTITKPTFGCVDYSVPAGTGNGTYTYYVLDDSGQAWGSTGGGTWVSLGNTTTGATAVNQGIFVWHNFIFVCRADKIDYAATNNPTSWTSGWNPATGGSAASNVLVSSYHQSIVAQNNDVVYICNSSSVASLAWNGAAAFDPTTTSTYTFNSSALVLPFDDIATSLAVLGTNLMVGGISNRIYPWNRTAPTYDAPLLLPEVFVWRMVNANNFLYVFMGNQLSRGRIYVTSGSAIQEFFKMPDALANSVEPYWLWGDAMWWRNHLIFGAQPFQNSGNTVLSVPSPASIWAVTLGVSLLGSTEQRFFGLNELISDTQIATVLLPVIKNTPRGGWDYYAGVSDNGGTSYNIYSPTSAASTAIGVEIESDIIPVGTSIAQKTFSQIEFKLSRPMTTDETITVYARSNLNDSWTQQGVLSADTTHVSPTAPFSFSIEKLQWIQIRLLLHGITNGSHVRVTEVRIR